MYACEYVVVRGVGGMCALIYMCVTLYLYQGTPLQKFRQKRPI